MRSPDVSVIVPVYNTMPYLNRCLDSLLSQSIGADRMEIIAVDDGSTDGSGARLDQLADRHPDRVTVLRQANSGGPAAPCNRGLEVAAGRYVFFLGADDFLAPTALAAMVDAADRWGSDVLLCTVVGVNNRTIHQEIFAATRAEVGWEDSALRLSLANTKLFRRDLIERHRLRFPEDMPLGSDQPFTIEACYRAGRISVLADADYYFAVRRFDGGNVTTTGGAPALLRCVTRLMEFVTALMPAGSTRDAVLWRHFALEVAGLLTDDLRHAPPAEQAAVFAGVRQLVARHLTATIRDQLPVQTRLRLSVEDLDALLAMIHQDAEVGTPATVRDGERWYAAYPGFRDPRHPRTDDWYDVTPAVAQWRAKRDVQALTWTGYGQRRTLVISLRPTRAATPVSVHVGDVGTVTIDENTFGLPLARLFDDAAEGRRRPVRVTLDDGGQAPLRAPGLAPLWPQLVRHGARVYAVAVTVSDAGQLMISVVPVTVRQLAARVSRWRRAA